MEKREDLDYIKSFSKIKISKACRHFNVDHANLVNGKLSRDIEKKIRKYIESEIANIYIKESEMYVKEDSIL